MKLMRKEHHAHKPKQQTRWWFLAWKKRAVRIWTAIIGIVTGIGTVIGVGLQWWSCFKPSPASSGRFTSCLIEPHVTLRDYLDEYKVKAEPGHYSAKQLEEEGMMVIFRVKIVGYRGRPCRLKWSMYDAESCSKLSDPLLMNKKGNELVPDTDDDEGSSETWMPLPQSTGKYFARLELLGDHGSRLDSKDSDAFEGSPQTGFKVKPQKLKGDTQ